MIRTIKIFDKEYKIEVADKTYEQQVENKIRKKYTLGQELAIQRQRDSKPQEFKEYFDYCELCKAEVKEKINK